ncbi:hypothetical protein SCHPADRAFT_996213 [Schizopora paradoxa]|uniref:F-box domain-containing protein n=1 Tax=Schizopora paradoxa TaxID=27342 RepID=A0A0H2RTS5_9AGAM|nr:hypothetical protein SCHPADRAFT_996213 [Schizopora paradoxa]
MASKATECSLPDTELVCLPGENVTWDPIDILSECVSFLRDATIEKKELSGEFVRNTLSSIAETHRFGQYSFLHAKSECWDVNEMWNVERISLSLEIMEKTKFLLDNLTSSLSENITRAKHRIQRITPDFLGRGLASLPDDILAMIIELAAEPLERSTMRGQDLAKVSQRFRAIALRLPRIWCAVSSKTHSPEQALLYLERSRNMGVHVSIEELYSPYRSRNLLQALIPLASQWRSFTYTGYHPPTDPFGVTEHRIPLQLPLMEHLSVKTDIDHVYKEYSMPNLRSATFEHMIPIPFSSTLTQFAVKLHSLVDDNLWDIDGLRRFLRSTPLLVELRLRFENQFRTLVCDLFDPEVLLPELKTLSVATACDEEENPDGDWESVTDFLTTIRAPNLTHMILAVKVDTKGCPEEFLSEFIENVLPPTSSSPALASLDLAVMGVEWTTKVKGQLHIRYDRIPHLTHLKLETNLNLILIHPEDKFFPLRRAEFVKCEKISNGFVTTLFRGLRINFAVWEALESVIFRACPNVDLDGNSSIVSEGKFHYEQYKHCHKADIEAGTEWEHDEDDFYPSSRTTASLLENLH